MKKIYLFLIAACSYSLNAQLTQANHAPANGDMYSMFQCDTVAPGASGANALWNFGSITTHSSVVSNYTAQSVSTSTYPAANVGLASSANNISYFNSSSSALLYYGGKISIGSGGTAVVATLNYTAPALFGAYPMSLNTTSTAAIGGSLDVSSPLTTTGTFTGTSTVLADGTGTIMLPGSVTYSNVMRVASSQTINFTTPFASGTVYQITYEYYEVGTKNPLFSIVTSTASTPLGSNTQTIVTRNKDAVGTPTSPTTGIMQHEENISLNVYPNPSSSFVNFVSENHSIAAIKVYDLTGKLVETVTLNDGKTKLDVSGYNKGIYFYNAFDSSNNKLKTGKFTVIQQ